MKQCILKALFCVLTIVLFNAQTRAQVKGPAQTFIEKEVVFWEYHAVTIGDDYTIYVHVPPGYDTTKTKYPVLYITDGDWDKNTASNSFNMLRQDYITNEAVIVGIGYGERPNQRDRDLDPTKGSANFLTFIEKEVIPFIESKYRVTSDRTLSGYSRGGEFAAYALFNRPGLFSTVCIGAPANSSKLVPYAQKYFAEHTNLKARIFVGVGSYEHETVSNVALFKDFLLKQNCKDLEIETDTLPKASHGAAKPPVIQNGIAFAFCKKHKAIALPVNELEKYTGTYILTNQPAQKLKLYVENGKLYFIGSGEPSALTPFVKDGFFQYENEKADILFQEDGGKMYIMVSSNNGKPTRAAERVGLSNTTGKPN
jgi:predicted alpha/beta superfamily hydrolase